MNTNEEELSRLNIKRAALISQIEEIEGRLFRRDKDFGGRTLTEPEWMQWKKEAHKTLVDLRRELREVRAEFGQLSQTSRQALYDQIATLRAQLAPLLELRAAVARHRPALEHLPDLVAALDACAEVPEAPST